MENPTRQRTYASSLRTRIEILAVTLYNVSVMMYNKIKEIIFCLSIFALALAKDAAAD